MHTGPGTGDGDDPLQRRLDDAEALLERKLRPLREAYTQAAAAQAVSAWLAAVEQHFMGEGVRGARGGGACRGCTVRRQRHRL